MRRRQPEVESIDVAAVHVSSGRRGFREEAIAPLMSSLQTLGLQTPITVRYVEVMELPGEGEVWGVPVLVAGRHRLEAARRLGWDTISCIFLPGDETDARLWEIAENLHRAELTVQERADHIAEWIRLTEEKAAELVSAQSEPKLSGRGRKGEGRPESGVKAAARDLGIDRNEAQRSVKIASIAPEAKAAAADAGVKTQAALLKVAAEPTPERQLARIREEQSKAEAHKANRQTDRVIALTEAQQFAEWLTERAHPQEMPTIIAWLEGTKAKDVTAAMRREAA